MDWAQHCLDVERLTHAGAWSIDLATCEMRWSPGMYALHGLPAGGSIDISSYLDEHADPADRATLAQVLRDLTEREPPAAGDEISGEFRIRRPDGTRILRWAGQRVGGFCAGAMQDVTELRRRERSARLRLVVADVLSEWETLGDNRLATLLGVIATTLDQHLASLWVRDREGALLVPRSVWSAPGLDLAPLLAVRTRAEFACGQGLPGQAWETGATLMLPRLEGRVPEQWAAATAAVGMTTATAVPVRGSGGVLAVVVLGGPALPDAEPDVLAAISRRLGRFFDSRRDQLLPSRLTVREVEVLRLAADGRTVRQVAEALGVSPSTVRSHFENVYEKLGVCGRAAAVAAGLRAGLIR